MKGTLLICVGILVVGLCAAVSVVYAQNPCSTGYKCVIASCKDAYPFNMSTGTFRGCSKSSWPWSDACVGTCKKCTEQGSEKICKLGTPAQRCTEDGVGLDCGDSTTWQCQGTYNNCSCGGQQQGTSESCEVSQCKTG
jgi:hypothetical protein